MIDLKPVKKEKYESNNTHQVKLIRDIDKKARELFAGNRNKTFMTFHPTLGYLARDYGLKQIAVENEGKEPTPSSLKKLIDIGKAENLRVIFVQREYDTKNARAIAAETGAVLETIDPLSENRPESEQQIINAIYNSFKGKQ